MNFISIYWHFSINNSIYKARRRCEYRSCFSINLIDHSFNKSYNGFIMDSGNSLHILRPQILNIEEGWNIIALPIPNTYQSLSHRTHFKCKNKIGMKFFCFFALNPLLSRFHKGEVVSSHSCSIHQLITAIPSCYHRDTNDIHIIPIFSRPMFPIISLKVLSHGIIRYPCKYCDLISPFYPLTSHIIYAKCFWIKILGY